MYVVYISVGTNIGTKVFSVKKTWNSVHLLYRFYVNLKTPCGNKRSQSSIERKKYYRFVQGDANLYKLCWPLIHVEATIWLEECIADSFLNENLTPTVVFYFCIIP